MAELTKRQEKILNTLIGEYIKTAEPVSSKSLAKKRNFDVCPATIRNELQELTGKGYIHQPHTSAGRAPTDKAYHYFVDNIFGDKNNIDKLFSIFIFKEVETVKQQIENELKMAEDLIKSLEEISSTLDFRYLPDRNNLFEILTKLGPSRMTYDKNITLIQELLKSLEEF